MIQIQAPELFFLNDRLPLQVNLSLLPGRLTFLEAPNGSGKTQFLRFLAGLGHPLFQIKGFKQVPQVKPSEVVYFGSKYDGDPSVSVSHFISILKKRWKDYDESLFESLEISGLLEKRLGQLSHGEFQRLQLFVAIHTDKKVKLFDEAFSHMDSIWYSKGRLHLEESLAYCQSYALWVEHR